MIGNNGKIILTQDFGKSGLKLPSGKVEKEEYIYEAAKREVKEETRLYIGIDKLVTVQEYFRELCSYLEVDFRLFKIYNYSETLLKN